MQPYIILSFLHIASNNILTRARTGQHAGSYEGNGEIKKIEDFICDGNYRIHSILRVEAHPERNGDLPRGTVFTLGDRLANQTVNNEARNRSVAELKIIDNDAVIVLGGLNATGTIRLVNAVKYVAPAPVVMPQPRVQIAPTRRTTNNNDVFTQLEQQIITAYPRTIKIGPNEEYTRGVNISRRRIDTLQEFLVKFFTNWNVNRATLYVDNDEIQTGLNKRRSLGDIFMICKYYFPNCTLREVAKLLYITLPDTITTGFRSSYCHTIHKRVWYYSENRDTEILDKTRNDEYGNPHRFYITNLE